MDDVDILYEVAGGIATIMLNRPDKMNAFTRSMCTRLIDAFGQADSDDAVRVIIVTGAGRAYSAGADLGASDTSFSATPVADRPGATFPLNPDASVDWSDASMRDFGGLLTLRMFDLNKPVICAINGAAAGMGATMTLAADIRIASTTAKFALPFVRRGIAPESASSWFLPRIVGISQALEWMLSGRTFPATEALAGGLVRSLHDPADLMSAAVAIAREIADNAAPVSVALTRQLLWRMLGADHPMEAHRIESRAVFARGRSKDIREGVDSFLERRLPHFGETVSGDMPSFFPWWEQPAYG